MWYSGTIEVDQLVDGSLTRYEQINALGSVWYVRGSLVRCILLYKAKILILCIDLRFVVVMHVGVVRHVGFGAARWGLFGTLGAVWHDTSCQ